MDLLIYYHSPSSPKSPSGAAVCVTIIDDDDPGILSWADEQLVVMGHEVTVMCIRRHGACGVQTVRIYTEEGTAKEGTDFEAIDDEYTFGLGEVDKPIFISIP